MGQNKCEDKDQSESKDGGETPSEREGESYSL